MPKPLRVLMVEDSTDDEFLTLQELRRGGYEPISERVETGPALAIALKGTWDLVLSDYAMPQFSGPAALAMVRELRQDLPFIVVSGTIGEDAAVDTMKAGADDYILKGNLTRLVPAIERELREAQERRLRREAEQALRESEAVFRALSASSPLGIFMTDVAGHPNYGNPQYRNMLGLSVRDSMGEGWVQVLHSDDRDRVLAQWREFVRTGGVGQYAIEFRLQPQPTTVRWVQTRVFPTRTDSGVITGFVGTVEDITERKKSELYLREAEAKYRTLVEQLPAVTYIAEFGRHGTWIFVSPQIETLLGFTTAEWIENPQLWHEQLHPDDRERVLAVEARSRENGESFAAEYRMRTRDNRELWFRDGAIVVDGPAGERRLHGVMLDVTDLKQLEQQLAQSQKVEAVGRLAGGVAHDFNNILTAISGYSELTLRRFGPEEPLRYNLEQISRAADRAASLTRQLLAFSRKQTLQPKVLDLGLVVDDVQKMLHRLIGEDIELLTKAAPNLRYIQADPGQIEQVILNLAVNARDAMPTGGRLLIETSNASVPTPTVALPAGEYVMLTVTDTGCGMTEEVKSHIFEPFYTTKPTGQGTGLGLATCYGVVTQSGGRIAVDSEVGKGTTFRIYLPSCATPAGINLGDAVVKPARDGNETLLLVEDDAAVRAIAQASLRAHGYEVWEAADGQAAVERVKQFDAHKIALVITDVVMPRMGGKELADQLRHLLPKAKILFTSGYTENVISHQGVLDAGINYLHKPYSPSSLARKVREVLDA